MTEETWKDIDGFQGLYQISNMGRVRSIPRKFSRNANGYYVLKGSFDTGGYPQVCLRKNGRNYTKKIHSLVARAFIPNLNGYREINHIDEDKTNNHVENLEWCTREYNINYGSRTEKTSHKVAQYTLDGKLVNTFPSIREASRYMGKKYPANIAFAVTNNRQAFGYLWRRIG